MAGFASTVIVQINNDGSITVEDDGRVPLSNNTAIEEHPDLKLLTFVGATLEGVMTVLKFGGKFSKGCPIKRAQ